MAFSQSIKRAQIPKPCELCETDTNIKWKCVQCNTLMCDKCKKIHLKVLTHDIVDVKSSEAKKEMEHTIITDNIPCQIHNRKMNCMFCRTCDHLVCPECITDSHKKHDLDSIDNVYIEKKRELKQLESQYTNKLTLCKIEDSKVNDFKTKSKQFFAESVQKIYQQEKFIIDEVRKYAKTLKEQLESERQRIEQSDTEKERYMKEMKKRLLNKQIHIQEILDSNQAAQVFSAYPEFSGKVMIPNQSVNAFPEETKDFVPAKANLRTISNLFGSLEKTKLPKGLPQVNLDVIISYTTDQYFINKVLMMDDKTAWISNPTISILRNINIDNTIKTVKDISVKVYDMSRTANNDVFLSLFDGSGVSLLTTKTGDIKPFLSVSPLRAKGIHVTEHNEIILGVRDVGDPFNLTDKGCRKIMIFEMDGKQKQSYEYDKHKQRLFTIPARITSNVNNDILVIDIKKSDGDGRVVVLDKEGQVKWVYQGNPLVNSRGNLFTPSDIVSSLGHVIVSDIKNHAFHVLSGEGDVLTCKVMMDLGIIFPMSLDFDTNGQIWVGCHSGGEQRTDAKLHALKLSF